MTSIYQVLKAPAAKGEADWPLWRRYRCVSYRRTPIMICTNWMLRDFNSYHLWAAWTSRHGSVSWLNNKLLYQRAVYIFLTRIIYTIPILNSSKKFIDCISRGVELQQFGDGSSCWGYRYIDDIFDGFLHALDRRHKYRWRSLLSWGESMFASPPMFGSCRTNWGTSRTHVRMWRKLNVCWATDPRLSLRKASYGRWNGSTRKHMPVSLLISVPSVRRMIVDVHRRL